MFEQFSPIMSVFEKLSAKSRRCFHWALMLAVYETKREVTPIDLLSAINKIAPEVLAEFDLSQGGLQLLSIEEKDLYKRIEASAGERGSGEVAFSSTFTQPIQEAFAKAAEAALNFHSPTIAPVHLLWGLFHCDEQLRARLEASHLTEAQLDDLCREDRQKDPWRARDVQSGIGYDLHRLAEGRKLILGGIEVPFEKGPVGHSDGDALAHAICDALLGAAGLGDIGTHFPDTDPEWKDVSSLQFLEHTRQLLDERGLRIAHIDAIVILERPKLGPRFPAMRVALAKALGIAVEQINLKAKTNEGVGEIGRGEAVAAQALATIER
jgi:2-C-methyl-D-erythritol 2,4-cyclodiphosphate synthase